MLGACLDKLNNYILGKFSPKRRSKLLLSPLSDYFLGTSPSDLEQRKCLCCISYFNKIGRGFACKLTSQGHIIYGIMTCSTVFNMNDPYYSSSECTIYFDEVNKIWLARDMKDSAGIYFSSAQNGLNATFFEISAEFLEEAQSLGIYFPTLKAPEKDQEIHIFSKMRDEFNKISGKVINMIAFCQIMVHNLKRCNEYCGEPIFNKQGEVVAINTEIPQIAINIDQIQQAVGDNYGYYILMNGEKLKMPRVLGNFIFQPCNYCNKSHTKVLKFHSQARRYKKKENSKSSQHPRDLSGVSGNCTHIQNFCKF